MTRHHQILIDHENLHAVLYLLNQGLECTRSLEYTKTYRDQLDRAYYSVVHQVLIAIAPIDIHDTSFEK